MHDRPALEVLSIDVKTSPHGCILCRRLDQLTTAVAPTMRQAFGVGPDTAAEMLVIFGDNPERIHFDAAFAKLCAACPVLATSGITAGRPASRSMTST